QAAYFSSRDELSPEACLEASCRQPSKPKRQSCQHIHVGVPRRREISARDDGLNRRVQLVVCRLVSHGCSPTRALSVPIARCCSDFTAPSLLPIARATSLILSSSPNRIWITRRWSFGSRLTKSNKCVRVSTSIRRVSHEASLST